MTSRRDVLLGAVGLVGAGVLTGCLSGSENGEFAFERVVFTDEDPDRHDSYEDVPEDATYTAGETVWLLVVVEHVPVDETDTATLAYTFETETPDGTTWDPITEREESWENVESTDVLIIWEPFTTYEDDPPGEYEMTITVEDQAEGERLETTETFTLTEA